MQRFCNAFHALQHGKATYLCGMKRIRTLIFAALFCCGAAAQTQLPERAVYEQYFSSFVFSPAQDWETVTVGDMEYMVYDNGMVFVKGCSPKARPKDLVIPSGIIHNGKPYQVTAIGMWAFIDCKSLKTVVISDGIRLIGYGAFNVCTNLESVTIPKSVKYVDCSFMKCKKCTAVKDGITYLGDILLSADTTLSRCVIEEGTRIIADGAFSHCRSLTSVCIPKSVKSIGREAFNECSRLESVEIPEGVEYIEHFTFGSCTELKSVVLPASLKYIADYAFMACNSLETVSFPSNDIWIEKDAFDKGIMLPSEDGIRYGGTMLIEVVDKNRTSYTIKEGTTRIGRDAFADCKAMTSIVIPESVTGIEDYAFRECTALQSVIIPEGVTEIGYGAFAGNTRMKSAVIADRLTWVGAKAFENCNIDTVIDHVRYIGNIVVGVDDNSLSEYHIKSDARIIAGDAFQFCDRMTSITLPDGIVSIGDGAFSGCSSLETINIPEGVTVFGEMAFSNCISLKSMELPASLTQIGTCCFLNCNKLKHSLRVPDTITDMDRTYLFKQGKHHWRLRRFLARFGF